MTVVIDASLLVAAGAMLEDRVALACRLERHSAYDTAYLTLAQELDGTCWTLDGRLVRNAARLELPVQLVHPVRAGRRGGLDRGLSLGGLFVDEDFRVPDLAAEGTVVLFIALAVGQAAGSVALGVLLGASPVLAFVVAGALGILAVLPAVRDPAAAGSRRATR